MLAPGSLVRVFDANFAHSKPGYFSIRVVALAIDRLLDVVTPRMTKRLLACGLIAILTLVLLVSAVPLRAADTGTSQTDDALARSILEKADQIRFPQEGFQVDVSVVTTSGGEPTEERKYRVLSRGNENTIVMVTGPASERGQILLMKGRDLWVFLPDVSQPVRLSLAQRLTGQVANGDLARANFTGDYTPKLLRNETVDGEKYNVLELAAVDRSVTYQRVVYWVSESTSAPHKAEFYSASNRLLKTC